MGQNMDMLLVFQFIMLLLWPMEILAAPTAVSLVKPGCRPVCGNVSIPYPFGIGEGCYGFGKSFEIVCDNSTSYRPFLKNIKLEVLEISPEGRNFSGNMVRVMNPIIWSNCGSLKSTGSVDLTGSPFVFSQTSNRFIAVGCNSRALMANIGPVVSGCESSCRGNSISGRETECSGESCCQATVPSFLKFFNASFEPKGTEDGCKYAFLADQQWFRSTVTDLFVIQNMTHVPVVLDWGIPDWMVETQNLRNRAKGRYSRYRCYILPFNTTECLCSFGYEGNAYLPAGCQDINECVVFPYRCPDGCRNFDGGYECTTNTQTKTVTIGLSSGFALLSLLTAVWFLYKYIKKRREIKQKHKFFKRNGGLLLEQKLSSTEANVETTKVFSSKELDMATDHFNQNRVIGQGGQGTVYKGMLVDGKIVAVKKSKIVDEGNLQQFINEVVILSQINHRNIVKILGCCLETEVPMLVYEFIPNGTLSQYLHDQKEEVRISWDMRLQIATEVAGALFYLHSAASIPIYHRDIKSTNILLDEKYKAKVSDFGTSRSVSVDQTHLTTLVHGTFGYLDPEYFQSSQFTDKSDVYSFGVVLVELLTGQKAITSALSQDGRSLATNFIIVMEDERQFDIFDDQVVKQGGKQEIMAVANLAKRCLNLNGRKRPTMREVATELEVIRKSNTAPNEPQNHEEIDYVRSQVKEIWDDSIPSSTVDMTHPLLH